MGDFHKIGGEGPIKKNLLIIEETLRDVRRLIMLCLYQLFGSLCLKELLFRILLILSTFFLLFVWLIPIFKFLLQFNPLVTPVHV